MLAVFHLGPTEIVLLLVVGVLLFGKKLPEVGRSLGKFFVELRDSLRGVETNLETAALPPQPVRPPERSPA